MTRIVHIALPLAGVGVYISLLAKNISSEFENSVICNQKEDIIDLKNTDGSHLEIHHVDIKRKINIINDIRCLIKIIKILKNINPDIIHCHSAKPGILGRIAGFILSKKTFYTPHAYSYLSSESKYKKLFYKTLERFFGLLPAFTLTCSDSEYNKAIFDLKIKKDKVFVWKNSIEDIFDIETETKKYKNNDFLCSIGRPSYQKNTLLLVKSILKIKKKRPNIHLVLLGVGFYSPSLKKTENFIRDHNLETNITLISWLKRIESLSILKKSKLFISTSRYEGLSYATLEAFALGKPCVLTNVDGNKDLIEDGVNGYLVKEDSEDISKKVIALLDNTYLLNKMSCNSRKTYEDFYNIKNNITLLEELYLR